VEEGLGVFGGGAVVAGEGVFDGDGRAGLEEELVHLQRLIQVLGIARTDLEPRKLRGVAEMIAVRGI
jgi:hypothetical protein